MTSPLDEELDEKWLPQATRKPIETRTITARSQVNRLHILGLISILHACSYPRFARQTGSSDILRRREISHICVSGKRGKSKLHKDLLEPQEAVGVARTHWANVKTSDC